MTGSPGMFLVLRSWLEIASERDRNSVNVSESKLCERVERALKQSVLPEKGQFVRPLRAAILVETLLNIRLHIASGRRP